jgi:hypothetical protein
MNKNNRLFTFGCSFTNYHYPTWADIIAPNFSAYQNWGDPGAGNNFILNSLVECHSRNVLNKDDTVIILWSGLARTDYYQLNHWGHQHNQYFDLKNNNTTYSCPQGHELLSYAWFVSAVMLLNQLNVNWKMFHWQQFDTDSNSYKVYKELLTDVKHAPFDSNSYKYKKLQTGELSLIADLYTRLAGPDWPELNSILNQTYNSTGLPKHIKDECDFFLQAIQKDSRLSNRYTEDIDRHPSPLQHLTWVQKFLPEYTITQPTVDWLSTIDQCLLNQQSYSFSPNRPLRF